ncbi:MAG TPA: hypothetical protein VJ577_19355 [Burkholderiaceae bacterium]|nr:hypothetical protein [Burkholderiaceae bacterium]
MLFSQIALEILGKRGDSRRHQLACSAAVTGLLKTGGTRQAASPKEMKTRRKKCTMAERYCWQARRKKNVL